MGLFGNFNWGRAAAGFFGGPDVVNAFQRNDALRQQRDQDEAERQARQAQIEAASQLIGPGGAPLFTKQQLNTMSSNDLSQLTREIFSPVNRGAEGGITTTRDPITGVQRHERSPGRVTDQGRVIDIDPEGNARTTFNARENDIEWETGPWGAFATDSFGRPIRPGTDITSPMGGPPSSAPQIGQPPAAQPQPGIVGPTSSLDPNSVFGRMIQQESRGQQFDARGRPLRSSAGAIGVAQVMPGTGPEAAALAGLPWDPRRLREDPQYNAALGHAYFQRQLQEFGDPVLAAAAYNAGPNRVRNALRRGGANWQAHIPQETRDYIRTVFGEGAGGTQTAQAGIPNIPGQGRSVQEQAAGGFVQPPQQAPPGYRWTQDGQLEPITGGPGDTSRQSRQDIGQVVQQYRSDPVAREWQAARTSTMQLRSLGASGNPADDVGMIFSFMRALDPNSTVREGEFATAQNTAGIPERVRNYYNQAMQGTLLGPRQRNDFIATAQRLYLERSRTYNEHIQSYHQQLRDMGVEDPANYVPIAMAPITADRQRREREQQAQDPNAIVDAVQNATRQMLPGTPGGIRILRRRRR